MVVISTEKFVDRCKDEFGWSDLSSDVIMNVGCGKEGLCVKAILEKFPKVGTMICIDKDPNVARNFKPRAAKMKCVTADIVRRETLKNYEGRITIVISTHVFDTILAKEEAFRNVYHLLKPGGEAAILFKVNSIIGIWLKEILKEPKWKQAFRGYYIEGLFKFGFGADQYKEMVQNIGFKVIECVEETSLDPYSSEPDVEENFHKSWTQRFSVPPESLEEFKEEGFQLLLKLSERDAEGNLCYRRTDLVLLISKPMESSGSETKANLGY